MRVFLVSNMWPDAGSPGYGSFVRNMAGQLESAGIAISGKALIKGKPAGRVDKLKKYLGFYGSMLTGFFGRHDAVYVHFPNQAVPLLRILARLRPKLPIVVNYHGEDLLYEPEGYTGKLGRMTDRFCRERADLIVVPSEYFRRLVVERGVKDAGHVAVSPSGGYNPDVFYPAERPAEDSASKPPRIGYVGRLEPDKGILEYLEVCRRLADAGIEFAGDIAGYGSLYDDVARYLRDHGLEDRVTLHGAVAQSKLGELYRSMDLLIFASSRASESLGLTGIEAMACGTPVVGTNVGGIASYVESGVNGYLVEPGDIDAMTQAVSGHLAADATRRSAMRDACLQTASRYRADVVGPRLAALFTALPLG